MTYRRMLALALFLVSTGGCVTDAPQPDSSMPVPFSAILALPASEPDTTLTYGSAPSQYGNLWLPTAKEPAPLVVLVHGGCWLAEYSVDHIAPLAGALRSAGYAVFAPEYRRVGEPDGLWPTPAEDLLLSLDALAASAPPAIDFSRTILAGHSAGGHLALWLAGNGQRLPAVYTVTGAVGLAAITDLVAYSKAPGSCPSATPKLMAASADEAPARYADASPAAMAITVPVTLLLGEDDPIVGADQATALSGARVDWLADAGHFDLIHPGTPVYPSVLQAIARYGH